MKFWENFQFSCRSFVDIMGQLRIIMSCKEILKKNVEKHWSAKVSIPKFLVKFWNMEEFCNSFRKLGRNIAEMKSQNNRGNIQKIIEKKIDNLQKNQEAVLKKQETTF